MTTIEIDLLKAGRGLVVAPAGCGKTQLIANTLLHYEGKKPILILTHTNAGVVALRNRMAKAGVKSSKYHISTIDGWAIKLLSTFPARSGHNPNIVTGLKPDYRAIRSAARNLLKEGHLNDILSANYGHLIVDECQDCSKLQLGIAYHAGEALATTLLGDEMQAIFDFGDDKLADWNTHTCHHFHLIGELKKPWRWINADSEELGKWLLDARKKLHAGDGIDLRDRPESVRWLKLEGKVTDHEKLLKAGNIRAENNGGVLIIGNSKNPQYQRSFASKIVGAIIVEAVDLKDMVNFAQTLDIKHASALHTVALFAAELMTNVGANELIKRVNSLQKGTARKDANRVEKSAIKFLDEQTHVNIRDFLVELQNLPGVKVYRPDVLRCCIRALNACDASTTFYDAAVRMREQNRMQGRPLPKKAVGSTLLLKGLEAEVVVILDGDSMNAKNLYVAMTRGAKKVVICSNSHLLGKT